MIAERTAPAGGVFVVRSDVEETKWLRSFSKWLLGCLRRQ
jgi:hypothetical protein